ncbi:MAG: hypothetical protein COY75_05765 [Nitrospirae bacterium CG_4_10_14_0_8_um_filter_41_23]|nr:AbrB/MazE/SpoVT family DNA-binding domain-containing protein [Nitrospirota bacterium]OIP59499.1 MAG: hypothetical protein AUK38_05375 [Nitrospirae bacterium CG2_30_41_42]PIQ94192.1 MAG: hypothetical protein COV68_05865 [Nitrospirae bacterium CG11_big_fil_rev_8_21_14_0_20_41_14]PIV43842.1 MAG: hypothetical protein COS27_03865 [Nitrospirae bacterium CG02_land_8_20_14_3_00_41_53]PIW87458.1 MAG: hypothetical protein COZ94_05010 [Nitrospirae bacterium CG_4_8_14_3_um_filter_41_47]PIY86877.1 MAG: 
MEIKTLTTVDRFGRVVIPKRIRKGLGLLPGSEVAIVKRDEEIIVSPVSRKPTVINKGGILVIRSEALEDIEAAVEKERHRRIADLIKPF